MENGVLQINVGAQPQSTRAMEVPPLEICAAVWIAHRGVAVPVDVTVPARAVVARMVGIFTPDGLGLPPLSSDWLVPACLVAAARGDIEAIHYVLWEQAWRDRAGVATPICTPDIQSVARWTRFNLVGALELGNHRASCFALMRAAAARQAAHEDQYEAAKWLVNEGGEDANTVVLWAAAYGRLRMAQWAVHHAGGDVTCFSDGVLARAAAGGHERIVRWVVDEWGKDARDVLACKLAVDEALVEGADGGHLAIVRYLVEKCGANVNRGEYGFEVERPLTSAAMHGHLPVVRYLVRSAGADVHAQDGEALLCIGCLATMQWLVEEGGMDEPRYTGRALALAVREGQKPVRNWLVNHILS